MSHERKSHGQLKHMDQIQGKTVMNTKRGKGLGNSIADMLIKMSHLFLNI